MMNVNAKTICHLVNTLPFEAFEHICEVYPDLLDLPLDKTCYIHWEERIWDDGSIRTLDDIANDWDYDSWDDLQEYGDLLAIDFDNGVLVIE